MAQVPPEPRVTFPEQTMLSASTILFTLLVTKSQKGQPKPPKSQPPPIQVPWQGPKRLIQMGAFELKTTRITSGQGGVSFSASSGNVSGGGASSGPQSLDIADPMVFSAGVADIAKTEFAAFRGFDLIEPAPPGQDGTNSTPPERLPRPQFILNATISDITVRTKSGGIRIGPIGGGKERFSNKVVIEMRFIDPETRVIMVGCKATGEKFSEANTMAVLADSAFGEVPVASFGEFQESPLGEATRAALQDGLKQLCAELMKLGWTSEVIDIQEADGVKTALFEVVEGLKVGDIIESITPGRIIRDPKSGRRLGETKAQILGQLKVTAINGSLVEAIGIDGFVPEVGHIIRPKPTVKQK